MIWNFGFRIEESIGHRAWSIGQEQTTWGGGDAARRAGAFCQLSVVRCPLQGKHRAIRIKFLLKYRLLATDYWLLDSLFFFPDTRHPVTSFNPGLRYRELP
jgi:hypothetical protein